MKKIRKFCLYLLVVLLGMFFTSCKKHYLPEPVVDNGQITIKSSALNTTSSDTALVEFGMMVNFKATSNGPKIASWQWTFGSTVLYGEEVSYAFRTVPPAVDSVKLLGIDENGNKYHATAYFKIVWNLDGSPAVKWISSQGTVHSGYNIILAFNKAGMKYNGSQYFYIGDMSHWVAINIPAEDTNYLLLADTLVTPVAGDIGDYVVVRLKNLAPGNHKMGVGKIINSQQLWGHFYDSTMVYFFISNNGKVILADSSINTPGSIGDNGLNAVLRFDFDNDSVVIYTNNQQNFNSIAPFVAFRSYAVRQYSVTEQSVTGALNWGKVKIRISNLPHNIIVMRFGVDTSKLWVFSPNMGQSKYWDPYYKVLRAQFIKVETRKSTKKSSWTVEPVR